MSSKRLREPQFDAETMGGRFRRSMRDDRGYMGFDLPELDTKHDPRGGALRAILLAWVAVTVMIAVFALWSVN
ncbi:MAG: hypothetical protein ACRDTT_04495 [Pseudonocardiaceae bacterium]